MPANVIAICQSTSCTSLGGSALVRDIEELANGNCAVEETLCLGHCGKGPNVELDYGHGTKKVVEGVNSFKKAVALVEDEAECEVSKAAKNVGKIKFEARRLEDAGKRSQTLQKAFAQLGDQAKAEASEPVLLSQLLAMRSGYSLKSDANKAVQDAEKAVSLHPKWAFANVILANAYEATKRYEDGIAALEKALEIGTCIKEGAVNRQLTRMKRMLPEPEPPVPAGRKEEPAAAPADAAGSTSAAFGTRISVLAGVKLATGEAKAKAKAKPKAKGKPTARPKNPAPVPAPAPAPAVDEGTAAKELRRAPTKHTAKDGDGKADHTSNRSSKAMEPDQEWYIDSVSRLNHDSLCMVLRAKGVVDVQHDLSDIWHLDLLKPGDFFGEDVQRSYTPVSSLEEYRRGLVKLMVKVYYTGKMTSYLAGLRPGSSLLVSPPLRTVTVEGYEGVVMVAGGSSVTVALQIFRYLLAQHSWTPFHLVLCNRTVEDVLYRDELEGLFQEHSGFSLVHCISEGPVPASCEGRISWKAGRISVEDLEKTGPRMRGVVSGPAGLCGAVLRIWRDMMCRDRERLTVLDELPPEEDLCKPLAINAGGSKIISL